MSLIFMSYLAIRCTLQPHLTPSKESVPWKTRLMSLALIWPVVALMLLILGGIYMGVMTPTEAAGMGAVLAIVLSAVKGRLTWQMLQDSLLSTGRTASMIMFIVAGAYVLGFGLTTIGLPRAVASIVLGSELPPLVIMMGVYLLYLGLGCLMGAIEMMLLTLAVVYPVVIELGFDSVWFGVVLTMLIEEAQITPPVGYNLFVLHGITKRPIGEIVRNAIPYFFMLLAGIGIMTAFPRLVLWLPDMMIPTVR